MQIMNETRSELNTDDLKAKAAKGAGMNIIMQFLSFLCNTLGVVVLARLLAPKDFGLVSMVSVISMWLMNFGANGFTEFIIQKKHITKEEVNSIFWLHLFVATILAVGFTCLGFFLSDFFAEAALTGIAAVMSIGFILQALSTSHLALLKRDMKFPSIAIAEMVAVTLSIVFAIAYAIVGMGYWAVVVRQLTIPAVTMIAAWLLSSWRPGAPRHLSNGVTGLKYALHVYSNFSLAYWTSSVDKLLLGKLFGPQILGYYDRAYYLSSMPASQLINPLHGVALATLSRLRNEKERFIEYYRKAVSIVAYLGIIAALILTLSAQDIVFLLLGPKWHATGRIVMAFGPGVAALLVYLTHIWLHLSLGRPDRWLRWNLFACALTILAFIFAAPFGAIAMAGAYSATLYILVLPGLWYAGRPIRLSIVVLIRSVWVYFVSAAAVCCLWLYLSLSWIPLKGMLAGLSPISRVLITSLGVSVLYIALVTSLQRGFSSMREILSLIKLMMTRQKS